MLGDRWVELGCVMRHVTGRSRRTRRPPVASEDTPGRVVVVVVVVVVDGGCTRRGGVAWRGGRYGTRIDRLLMRQQLELKVASNIGIKFKVRVLEEVLLKENLRVTCQTLMADLKEMELLGVIRQTRTTLGDMASMDPQAMDAHRKRAAQSAEFAFCDSCMREVRERVYVCVVCCCCVCALCVSGCTVSVLCAVCVLLCVLSVSAVCALSGNYPLLNIEGHAALVQLAAGQ
jgi:hypothetical protein